ncbi:MAG: HAD family hydrolase [Chloroflexi bacterium]|nr:HAD family hydrolase [Chloroflexota bacterium]
MLRAVTFDFWGTLADAHHSNIPYRVRVLAGRLAGVSQEEVLRAYEAAWQRFRQAMQAGYGLPPAAMLSMTLDFLGIALPPTSYAATLRQWEEAMLEDRPSLLPGALDVLRAVRRRGLAVGLICDTVLSPGRVIREFLWQLGARPLFDWLTFSNEIGATKHTPQPFRYTLRALGVAPEQALHVGDTPEADIVGARAVGMHTALLLENSQRCEGAVQAEYVLERLQDLPALLGVRQ